MKRLPNAEPQVLPLSWQAHVQEFCHDMEVKTVAGYLIVDGVAHVPEASAPCEDLISDF